MKMFVTTTLLAVFLWLSFNAASVSFKMSESHAIHIILKDDRIMHFLIWLHRYISPAEL